MTSDVLVTEPQIIYQRRLVERKDVDLSGLHRDLIKVRNMSIDQIIFNGDVRYEIGRYVRVQTSDRIGMLFSNYEAILTHEGEVPEEVCDQAISEFEEILKKYYYTALE